MSASQLHNITRPASAMSSVALADERTSWDWSSLDEHLSQATNALLTLDPGPERRLAVFASNSTEAVVAHLAGILAGMSTIPISSQLTADELAFILTDSGASILLVGPETESVGAAAAEAAGVDSVYGWRRTVDGKHGRVAGWEELVASGPTTPPPTTHAPLPHLHYTSGTTGTPKGVETPPTMFAGGDDITEHLAAIAANPMLALGGCALVVGPIHHTGPLSSIRGVLGGMGVAVLSRFDPGAVLAAIEEYGVTTTVMVPTHFQRLLTLPEADKAAADTSSLILVVHTGAACPVDVKRAMISWWGPVLFEAYGGTESGTTNAISSQEWLEHPGSVGRPVEPFEVLIVGEDGSPVADGDTGVIYLRDTSGRGVVYRNDPDKTTAAHLEPGVFTLGDMGHLDSDGYLYITDRVSDMIVSGGVNVYPAEAEQVLLEHAGVADVACIGVPDDDKGEKLLALIVPDDPNRPPPDRELDEWCTGRLAPYKAPRFFEIVPGLDRDAMGKISKRKLRAPYWPDERTISG